MARILLVDDEISILTTLSALLGAEGHETVSALDGQKAKDLLGADSFDVMICDIRMSPVHGMEVLRHAREMCPAMAVIMLTAYGQVDTAIEAMELGAFSYLKKPFHVDELVETVRKALQFHEYNIGQDG